ncbi:type II toxin-antitoxin system VapC family toxin [Aestuariivirga sp.]|uniref:type II toxin-antitoxin system VapC family toxin n=1 Tax=Aestuariivirga sp. TaxID=2650926 RepID=UPI0039E26C98
MSETYVLDASAILCLLFKEPGADAVESLLSDAVVSTVNYAEAVSKLYERGIGTDDVAAILAEFRPDTVDFDLEQAISAAALRPLTKARGLSLGDRACLALAAARNATAVTTDRAWADVPGVRVMVLR